MVGKGLLIKRALGIGLMAFSTLGLVISLVGLVLVWRFSGHVAASADDALEVSVAALDSTRENLDLTHAALGEAGVALAGTQTFIEAAGNGMANTSVLIDSLSDVLAGDMPKIIRESQSSLSAAEEGAAVIERMLYGLNTVSGLTGVRYAPDVSLTESFSAMNESLDTLPDQLAELDESLRAAQDNLDDLQTAALVVSQPLEESQAVLAEAQISAEAYSGMIEDLTVEVSALRDRLPGWIRVLTWSLSFLMVWLAISQVGLLWQGWEMMGAREEVTEDRLRRLEEKLDGLIGHR
ncbi:MAG TPA: hypothetical protein ENO24_08295 [Chloroflexi bacterium]|nr:hypothetical protein [Chloroflexota bacterium]